MHLLILLLLTAVVANATIAPDKIENVRGLLRDHKVTEAESAANSLVAAHPADAEAHALLARVCLAKNDADGAVKAGEKAVALAPANSDLQLQLGDTYGFAAQKGSVFSMPGWAKKCRLAYEKAVELDPANLTARSSLLGFCQQAPGLMGGGLDKAYEQAAAIKKLDAARGRVAYATLYGAEKKYDLALTEFDAALKLSPDDYAALYQMDKLSVLSGQFLERGLASLRRCLELTPPDGAPGHAAAQWRIGNILEKKNDSAGARAAYDAALQLDPKFAQAADSLKKMK